MFPFQSNVASIYGAPMGRRSDTLSGKVHLRRVPAFDGDYDQGGAYWGSVAGSWRDKLPPLWCAWNDEGAAYFRAWNREDAKTQPEVKGCTFFR
jgi:hypothetical protein